MRLWLNGKERPIQEAQEPLLQLLRRSGLTAAKEGCGEGECGACLVAVQRLGADGRPQYTPVNACLLPAGALAGERIITVEALSAGGELHPVQQALVATGGSQCGYCTPGFVMALFAEYYRAGREGFDREALSGNLCRCTGYRPIVTAGETMGLPAADDPWLRADPLSGSAPEAHTPIPGLGGAPGFLAPLPRSGTAPAPAVGAAPAGGSSDLAGTDQTAISYSDQPVFRPASLTELFTLTKAHPEAVLLAGGTDLGVELSLRGRRFPALIALDRIPDLQAITEGDGYLELGASLPLTELRERLGGRIPLLAELFPLFASLPIRNRATLGGNLATASPIGDGAPVLLALNAELGLVSPTGERILPLSQFFLGYRRTALAPDELIAGVRIPTTEPTRARFYKVAKRQEDDISTVSAAFAIDLAPDGTVTQARLAFGGVAATPARATAVEEFLHRRPWNQATVDQAAQMLESAFQPLSDHRGSAAYRRALLGSLLKRFWHETGGEGR